MDRNFGNRELEALEVLAGIRRQNVGQAAVRLDDLSGLLTMPESLKSTKADDSIGVTVDQFNALVEDVTMLHTRLRAIVAALRTRRGRQ